MPRLLFFLFRLEKCVQLAELAGKRSLEGREERFQLVGEYECASVILVGLHRYHCGFGWRKPIDPWIEGNGTELDGV